METEGKIRIHGPTEPGFLTQCEDRIHRPRIGVGIISLDEVKLLATLKDKERIMAETLSKLES